MADFSKIECFTPDEFDNPDQVDTDSLLLLDAMRRQQMTL